MSQSHVEQGISTYSGPNPDGVGFEPETLDVFLRSRFDVEPSVTHVIVEFEFGFHTLPEQLTDEMVTNAMHSLDSGEYVDSIDLFVASYVTYYVERGEQPPIADISTSVNHGVGMPILDTLWWYSFRTGYAVGEFLKGVYSKVSGQPSDSRSPAPDDQ